MNDFPVHKTERLSCFPLPPDDPGTPPSTWIHATSLLSGLPIGIPCPRSLLERMNATLQAICPKDLPPRAKHRGDFLLPRELLDVVRRQQVTALTASSTGDGLALSLRLEKCCNCGKVPRIVYTSPGTGCFIEFPYCGQNFCPVCMLIDSRSKVGRFRPLLGEEIKAEKPILLMTLSFGQSNHDSLAELYASFCRAWKSFAGGKTFRSLVQSFFGGIHFPLKCEAAPEGKVYSWRLHFHLFAVCHSTARPSDAEAQLLSEWNKAVERRLERSSVGSWAEEFRVLRNEFLDDSERDSATRILKYLLNGLLGPWRDPVPVLSGGVFLPVRSWPLEKFLEAIATISKRGFQRFRASQRWKEAAKGNQTLRLYRRRRRNAANMDSSYLKAADYLQAIESIASGTTCVPHAPEIMATLPEVYLDASLNECWWLANKLRPLLYVQRPDTPDARSGA